ncbi:hypothetical protein ICL81_04510 [Leucobacter sp. cx-328]|uniref:hypothetical protein n=1 Tax=unclassified Leucobacter TaxID=2621730 RepID=UPI00165E5F27|nr:MULTISPECIES: hypothetical protein [unclassified Leucobacter]MBC9943788.1 hypothetical protein [Leucobacter sp. cx-328]
MTEDMATDVARFVEVFGGDDDPLTHAVGLVSEDGDELIWSEGSPATIMEISRKLARIAKTIEHNKFGPVFLDVAQVAERTLRHPVTVRIALDSGALHGMFSDTDGWIVEWECAEAWNAGLVCNDRLDSSLGVVE